MLMRTAVSKDDSDWRGSEYAGRWLALAQRRRDNLVELYRSGRWRRYYTEAKFLAAMRDVKADIEAWSRLANSAPADTVEELREAV